MADDDYADVHDEFWAQMSYRILLNYLPNFFSASAVATQIATLLFVGLKSVVTLARRVRRFRMIVASRVLGKFVRCKSGGYRRRPTSKCGGRVS